MKEIETNNIKSFNTCLLLLALILLIVCINSIDTTLDNYGKFSWYLDYSEGFLKRALPGQLLRIYYSVTDQPFTHNLINESIQTVHIIFVILFLCLLSYYFFILVQSHKNSSTNISIIFGLLLCSYFIKEIFDLTGYLDIIVSTLVLLSVILYLKEHYLLSVIIISVSCFVSEISMFFWLPILALNIFIVKASKFKFILLLPVLVAVSVHFLSCVPESLPKMYENTDIQHGMVRYISKFFTDQRDIPSLIKDRFTVISGNITNVIIGFFYLSFISISFYVITLEQISKIQFKNHLFKILTKTIFFICSFAPSFLILLAVDFWRLIYFSVYSSFLTLTLICKTLNNFSINSKPSKLIVFLSFIVSVFTLFSPPVKMSETKMIVKNDAVLETIDYKYQFKNYRLTSNKLCYLLQDYYNNRNGTFDRVGWNKDIYEARICKNEGNVMEAVLASPGHKKIMIEGFFAEEDPDQIKLIDMWGTTLEIKRDQKNIYETYFPHDLATRVPIKIVCKKSAHDWNIKQFVIVTVENQ